MDLSAEFRRGGLGRRQESRSPGDFGDRSIAVRNQAFHDSVRCHRQSVGAICGVGLGGRRRLRSASVAEWAEDHQLRSKREKYEVKSRKVKKVTGGQHERETPEIG